MLAQTLSEQLGDRTRPRHDRLEALPFAAALADGTLAIESYLGYLRALAVVHGVLEQALSRASEPAIAQVWQDDMRRLPALLLDIEALGPRVSGSVPAAASVAQGIADQVLRWAIDQPAGLLGYLYVLEGSRLGATVLGPQAQRAFNLRDNHGCAYLTQDAEHASQTYRLGVPRTSTG